MQCTLVTRQVTPLAILFDCLRHVTGEITLQLSADGLRIAQLEGNNSLYIYAHMLPDRFELYVPPHRAFEATILPATMHLVLTAIVRKVRSDSACLLQLRFSAPTSLLAAGAKATASGALQLDLQSADMDTTGEISPAFHRAVMAYELPCRYALRCDKNPDEMAKAFIAQRQKGYDQVMYMSQRHLAHLVSHVFPLGEVVQLFCGRQYVTFAVTNQHSMIGRARVRFKLEEAAEDPVPGRVYQFRQPLLSMLLRALSLYNTTAMVFPIEDNMPVIMETNLGDLGKLTVAIAQVAEEAMC